MKKKLKIARKIWVVKNHYLVLFFLLLSFTVSATPVVISGYIFDEENKNPIESASIIIPVFDIIEYSDKKGYFAINADLDEADIEIIFMMDGYYTGEMIISASSQELENIYLKRALVEMPTIIVVAPKEGEIPGSRIFSENEIENISTGGDPVQIAVALPGILSGSDVLTGSTENFSTTGGIPLPEFIVRGLPANSNLFFYDYIKMPTLYHSRGLPFPSSIIPQELTESVEILKGGYGVEYGPGFGGLFHFRPSNEIPNENKLNIQTSLVNADFYMERSITPERGLFVSIRKSLFDLTYQPLDDLKTSLEYDLKTENMIDINYGDIDYGIKLLWKPSVFHSISLDLIGLYDYWTESPFRVTIDNFYKSEKDIYFKNAEQNYQLHSQGVNWEYKSANGLNNSLYLYNQIINGFNGFYQYYRWSVEEAKIITSKKDTDSNLIDTMCFGDKFSIVLPFMLKINTGFESSYIITKANRYRERISGDLSDNDLTDENYEINGWVSFSQILGSFTVFGGIRDDYFEIFNKSFLSYRGGLSFFPSEKLEMTLSAGLYPGAVDYLSRASSIETLFETSNVSQDKISQSFFLGYDSSYIINQELSVNLETYYNKMSDLSGSNVLTEDANLDLGTPEEGKTMGVELSMSWNPEENISFVGCYTLASSEYYFTDYGWVSSNSDIRHQVSIISAWTPIENLNIGFNFRSLIGMPFTPFKITGIMESSGDYIYEYDPFNSGRDYIPRFLLDFSVAWDFKLFGQDSTAFMDITNLLNGPIRLDVPASPYVGMDTSNLKDRDYYVFTFIDAEEYLPVLDFGIKMQF